MKHTKIAIIGAGAVGTTTAYSLMLQNITAEIILVDTNTQRCKGEILDLSDALSFSYCSSIRQGSIDDAREADIIIIAAGVRQRVGQSRTDLLDTNMHIIQTILSSLKPVPANSLIIMVTNPVDTLTLYAQQILDIPKNQIFGSGTFLDTLRLKGLISQHAKVAEKSVNAYIIGEHGDSQCAIWSSAHIGGIQIYNFNSITPELCNDLEQQIKNRAYEIIATKGATYFGIATALAIICKSIIFNQKVVMPVSCYQKEFGVCLSLPSIVGQNGIEQTLQIDLDKLEKEKLSLSIKKLRQTKKLLY